MKKWIAIALVIVMVLGLAACTINDKEVAVLWSGDNDVAVVPNSLINALDRAMYIENISYKHYAAKGSQDTQTKQAEEALNAGCGALMVELVDASAAQTIVDLAKAKDVPVVFFGCDVDAAVVSGYAKCAAVVTDADTLASTYSELVNAYLKDNVKKTPAKDDLDLNDDGKITYLALGELTVTPGDIELVAVNGKLEDLTVVTETRETTTFFFIKGTEEIGKLTTADGTVIELILADDDTQTLNTLVALQELGFNSTRLATHFVPVITVGAEADYKAYVLQDLPADAQQRAVYLEEVRSLIDMTTIEQNEWTKWEKKEANQVDTMIFNTMNQIDAGKINGTVVEDYDALAVAAAKVLSNLLQGKALEQTVVAVPYAAYK